MSKLAFSVTKDGKPLSKALYKWDKETKTFSTTEDDLVLDFKGIDNCTFITGFDCTFVAGSYCTFVTGSGCTFETGAFCVFNTGADCRFNTSWDCTFKTSAFCTFDTNSGCMFDTGSDCTFRTSDNCMFNTGADCTFTTGSGCSFKTNRYCTFKTGADCTFATGSYCTFDTGFGCKFGTGSECTFNTMDNCRFDTGADCTFDTGVRCTFDASWNCTFNTGDKCILIRRDNFEHYDISNKQIQTCPYCVKGYIENGYYYINGEKQYKAIIVDGILSEVISHRGNVYKVKNCGKDKISYIIQDGNVYSHGDTIKKARKSLIYKVSNRDTSIYSNVKLDDEFDLKDIIKMYRTIAGACESGTRYFVETHRIPDRLTVRQAIDLTKGQYNSDIFRKFFEDKETNKV